MLTNLEKKCFENSSKNLEKSENFRHFRVTNCYSSPSYGVAQGRERSLLEAVGVGDGLGDRVPAVDVVGGPRL